MPVAKLFLSLDGRIGRKMFWLAQLVLLPLTFIVLFALTAVGTGDAFSSVIWNQPFADRWTWGPIWFGETVITFWPNFAVWAKRLHDRNKRAWIYLAITVAILLSDAVDFLGYGGTDEAPSPLWWTANAVAAVIFVWFLIEAGFPRGTKGPNRFGADPLPPSGGRPNPVFTLMFGFDGRIGRGSWWRGMGVAVGLFVLLWSVIGVAAYAIYDRAGAERWLDKEWLASEAAAPWLTAILVVISIGRYVVTPFFIWLASALAVKRLHDQNLSAWWLACLPAMVGLAVVARAVGDGSAVQVPPWLAPAALVMAALAVLWLIVQLGIRKGDLGANHFGPPPPEAAAGARGD